ncbi:MAG: diguanylate cyclase [Campylobacterota bacterium]|nr:diguanylate cyclase [Campylobacterota bacterium]
MHFQSIGKLADTEIITISIHATYAEAVDKIQECGYPRIIVVHDNGFSAFSIHDILRINHEKDFSESSVLTLDHFDLTELPVVERETNILDVFDLLHFDVDDIIVVNPDGSMYGLVTYFDIISSIDPDALMDNFHISDLIKTNKRSRWVSENEITQTVLDEMAQNNHHSAMIVKQQKPIGIVTSKDIIKLLEQKSDLSLPIKHYITHPVITIHYKSTINEALKFIKDKHFKRIVTVDDKGKLVSVITQKELIATTYSHWVKLMKDYYKELNRVNGLLEIKNEKFEKIASTDSLTGLYNRMKFIELYLSEYTIMVQRDNTMSLIMIDLDHFKNINDDYGHNVGDKVLKEISALFLSILRNVDVLCRWGGEEFVALLPTANLEQTAKIAEKIRHAIDSHKTNETPHITASFGVTQIRNSDTLDEAINRADQALYDAKDAGRNCVRTN